jgi:chromosomal replication initiation ATPase DnaA
MDFWSEALIKISKKISKPNFENWFLGTKAEINNEVIIVESKSEFTAEWLENRYKALIIETLKEVTGKSYEANFTYSEDVAKKESMMFSKDLNSNSYGVLKGLIKEQIDMINKQQGKIEELEQRIRYLEQRLKLI